MRALRKTRLKKNMAQVFWLHLEESDSFDLRLWKLPRRGNRGKPLHVFHRFHRAWKTRPTTPEFPTVPTASNAGYCSGEKKKQRLREGLTKIEWTRCSQKRKNPSSRPLSIGRF